MYQVDAESPCLGPAPVVILRRTQKLRSQLPESPKPLGRSDGALGDWYVHRTVLRRQPLLLLVSSASLLAVLTRARDVCELPDRLPELVADRLSRLGVTTSFVNAEAETLGLVQIAPTADRSVVGIMVDYAKMLPFYLPADFSDAELRTSEERLWDTPCHAGKGREAVVFPDRATHNLLQQRWGAG